MTPQEFKAWRIEMGFSSQQEAANALGISKSTVEQYEAGRRRDNDRTVEIPVYIGLACNALRMARGNAYNADGRVEAWHASAREKYLLEVVECQGDRDLAKRHFQLTYGITRPEGQEIEPGRLVDELRLVNSEVKDLVRYGWSMFHLFNRKDLAPRMVVDRASGQGDNDFLECSLLRGSETDASDFWRMSRDGLATILRGYFEDRPDTAAHYFNAKAGTFLNPNWMVRDAAEIVRHARALASRYPDATGVTFRCGWDGLGGRAIADPRALWHPAMYRFDEDVTDRASKGTWRVGDLKEKWPEIAAKLVAPVMRAANCDNVVTADWIRGQAARWRSFD